MSLLGKLLAILNVLAAVLFVAVAGLDWMQRQRWEYVVFRHDLFVDGLPIDDKEKGPDLAPRVTKFTEPWFGQMFQHAGGGSAVKTQTDEVNNLKKLIGDKVASPEVAGTKSQKLAGFLRALARTQSEREDLTRQMADQTPDKQEALEALQKQLDDQFAGVNELGANGQKQSLEERKANAARLLFCLREALQDPKDDFFASNDYKRYLLVVGLPAAAHAADDEALLLVKMTEETIRAHDVEREQFVYDHGQKVELSQSLADAVDAQDGKWRAAQAEVAKLKLAVDDHKIQIGKLVDELEKYRKETRDNLVKQAQAEEEVMSRLIDLRDTAKKNQELEREIRMLEGLPATP